MISSHSKELINGLIELAKDENKNIRLQAIKTLLNKIIPDLKEADVKNLIIDQCSDKLSINNDKTLLTCIKAIEAIKEDVGEEQLKQIELSSNSPEE